MSKNSKTANKNQKIRQPIVAVMGHVDHGKTTFLDAIRGTRIAEKEFGGITQNTRVHEVTSKTGFKITFIDTPGHEAFSAMRERGARVTDFVFLVVAADDGIQPQTRESIEFAQKHSVPIIVGINKIDVEGADILKVKTQLASFGVQVEEFGGDVLCFPISAKNKVGLDEALEGIELLSELNELKPHETKENILAEAFVLESNLDKKLGHCAVCILKAGHLNQRVTGFTKNTEFKVRAYINEEGKPIQTVEESQPFTVTGLSEDLHTGDIIYFAEDRKVIADVQSKLRSGEIVEDSVEATGDMDAETLFAQMLMNQAEKKSGVFQKELNLIIRASTQGTLEALKAELQSLETEESKVNILAANTGFVTEDDITRAKVAKAIIVTFQSPTPSKIMAIARNEKVLVRDYEIIYNIIDEIAEVLDSLDQPKEEEVEVARAKVKQVFTLSDGSMVVGCEVTKGTFVKGYRIWIESGEYELGRAKVKMIKQAKNEVKEVKKGSECGLQLDSIIDGVKLGDEVVAFRVEKY